MFKLKGFIFLFLIFSLVFLYEPKSKAESDSENYRSFGGYDECCDSECYQDICTGSLDLFKEKCGITIVTEEEEICQKDETIDCMMNIISSAKGCSRLCSEGELIEGCDDNAVNPPSQEEKCKSYEQHLEKNCGIEFIGGDYDDDEEDDEDACGC